MHTTTVSRDRGGNSLAHRRGAASWPARSVITQFQRLGRRTLWPSQAQAVAGGLLDRGHPSLAIKLPTSCGKTLLIELTVADALDADTSAVAAVVAPTPACWSSPTSGATWRS